GVPPVGVVHHTVCDAVVKGDAMTVVRNEGVTAAVPNDNALDNARMRTSPAFVEVHSIPPHHGSVPELSVSLSRTDIPDRGVTDHLRLGGVYEDVSAASGRPLDPDVAGHIQHFRCRHTLHARNA